MRRVPVIAVLALAIVLIGALVYWLPSSKKNVEAEHDDVSSVSEATPSAGEHDAKTLPKEVEGITTSPDFARAAAEQTKQLTAMGVTPGMSKEQMQQRIADLTRAQRETVAENRRKPIEFYGRVLDQEGQPVAGVQVHLLWTDTSTNGTSERHMQTDAQGQFSLSGTTGRLLQVWLSKDGYYVPKTNQNNFDYATGYLADPSNPVIFRLVKKGEGADLITSQYGIRPDFTVAVPKNGNPIRVDMLQRKAGDMGQLEMQSWIETDPATHRTTSWRLRLAIPDGGFVEHQDEFPFTAPEHGYQPELVFPPPNASNVRFGFSQKTYYIAFGQPRRYGRIQISASASTGNVMLQYTINPDGSRNLEPK